MSWIQIKQLKEQRQELLNGMKAILAKADTEKRSITTEEDTKFNELNGNAETMAKDIARRETLYAAEQAAGSATKETRQHPGNVDLNTPEQSTDEAAKATRAAFNHYLCAGMGALTENETRSLTISAMGVVGDRPFYSQLVTAMKSYTGVREAGANVIPTSDGNTFTVPLMDDTSNTGRLVGEAATNSTATDGTPGNLILGAYKFDSDWCKVSIELLQDNAFNAEAYIIAMAGERIGRAQNVYTTTGSGSGQPKGVITAGSTGKTSASKDAITYDEVVDFIHSLDAAYRNTGKCAIELHDTTLAALRKLKTGSNGYYIWSPGEAGQPNSILGFRYIVNNNFGQIGTANATLGAILDPTRYYIRDVSAPLIIRADELFASDGLVGFKIFQRMDAGCADASSIKLLKAAAS